MLVIRKKRSEKGHWWGYFPGQNISVVVEGSLADTPEAAIAHVNATPFTSEADSEREVTNDNGGVITVKGKTYFYGEFTNDEYVKGQVNELKGKKTEPLKITYLD